MTVLIRPIDDFQENIRPAKLLLTVYKLLACDEIKTSGEMLEKLRHIVGAHQSEDLLLVHNQIFLGLVRQRASVPHSDLKPHALDNLLRQAVVVTCTALDAYLPALLKANLFSIIQVRGRDFLPRTTGGRSADETNIKQLNDYLKKMVFSLEDMMRILDDSEEAPLFIANKILGYMSFSYLSSSRGILVAGSLLGLEKCWETISQRMGREATELRNVIDKTTDRRNDIVHRADRSQEKGGQAQDGFISQSQQPIDYIETKLAVEIIENVCLVLDALIEKHLIELKGLHLEQVSI